LQVSPAGVTAAYCQWLHFKNPHANVSSKWLLEELKQWGWEGGGNEYRKPTKDRERYWLVPQLDQARHLFKARIGTDPFAD
jgi:hypothetical protein